jgi:hypothetical protein
MNKYLRLQTERMISLLPDKIAFVVTKKKKRERERKKVKCVKIQFQVFFSLIASNKERKRVQMMGDII